MWRVPPFRRVLSRSACAGSLALCLGSAGLGLWSHRGEKAVGWSSERVPVPAPPAPAAPTPAAMWAPAAVPAATPPAPAWGVADTCPTASTSVSPAFGPSPTPTLGGKGSAVPVPPCAGPPPAVSNRLYVARGRVGFQRFQPAFVPAAFVGAPFA
jgi:hypothetical protein